MLSIKSIICLLGTCLLFTSSFASAKFYVDYQGLDKERESAEALRRMKGAPDGYRLLTNKSLSFIHEIGKGEAIEIDSFGAGFELKDAVTLIMPDKWIAYIDEHITVPKKVDWQAKNIPWTEALGIVGMNNGYRFIVDWDQKLLQVTLDENYTEPDYNDPVTLEDSETGRTIFVYSAKPVSEGGIMLVNGEPIKFKLID